MRKPKGIFALMAVILLAVATSACTIAYPSINVSDTGTDKVLASPESEEPEELIAPLLFEDYETIEQLLALSNWVIRGTVVSAWQDSTEHMPDNLDPDAEYIDYKEFYQLQVNEVLFGRQFSGELEVISINGAMQSGVEYVCFLSIKDSVYWEMERIALTNYESVFPIDNQMVSYPEKYNSEPISYDEFKASVNQAQAVAFAQSLPEIPSVIDQIPQENLVDQSDFVIVATVASRSTVGSVAVCALSDINAIKGDLASIVNNELQSLSLPKYVEEGKRYMIFLKANEYAELSISARNGCVLEEGSQEFMQLSEIVG